MHREPEDRAWSDERQIRAVVLALPAGNVAAEALWTVHDRVRYLWMLKDGHFLLRDRDGLEQGDATLELKPLLLFRDRCCGWRWIRLSSSSSPTPGSLRRLKPGRGMWPVRQPRKPALFLQTKVFSKTIRIRKTRSPACPIWLFAS